jgi:transcriptional regulator with XRE-family HTH domain
MGNYDWANFQTNKTGSITSLTSAAFILATVGTGGMITPEYFHQYVAKTRPQAHTFASLDARGFRTPKEDLDRIREFLKPAVSDLANILGVSRQSIYNWINGEAVAEENAAKLQDLAEAADILDAAGVTINGSLLRRKFSKGRTLFQVAQAGDSAAAAARLLVEIHKHEDIQRKRLQELAQLRPKGRPATADFDLPAPNDPPWI